MVKWKILAATALGVALMVAPALGQYSTSPSGYASAGYGGSTLLQTPQNVYGADQQPAYEAYWHNYLDQLQQQGGYYAVSGNYPGSVGMTSIYPAGDGMQTEGQSAQPYAASAQSGQYATAAGAQNPQYQQQYQQYQQSPQYQQYQGAPEASASGQAPGQKSTKKRRLSAKRAAAEAAAAQQQAAQQQAGQQAQQPYAQQGYDQQAAQQQAYQQQAAQQQYYQQQQQQAAQQSPQQGYQQDYQQQQAAQQQAGQQQDSNVAYSADPNVQDAQRRAYERAVARQRGAEMAAHQQAAAQELLQTQKMYETAQRKLQEQEGRQQALRQEYHRKAVAEAYDGLRNAQSRYYELMGVSGETGQPQAGAPAGPRTAPGQAQPYGQQQPQYAQQGPAQGQQFPQPVAAPAYNQRYAGAQQQAPQQPQQQGYPVPPGSMPVPGASAQGAPQYQAPSGQPTPLTVQGQEEQSSGGFWGAVKEIFAPSQPVTSPRQGLSQGLGQKRGDLTGE